MNRHSLMRSYLPWILLCLALAGTILLLPTSEDPIDTLPQTDLNLEPGKKITSAKSFASLLAKQDTEPLYQDPQYQELTADSVYPIHLEFEQGVWDLMVKKDNRRFYKERPSDAVVQFGDRSRQPAVISMRGRGSLKMENKPNFRVRLTRKEAFTEEIEIKSLYLMNMQFDKAEYLMAWSYGLLRELGLFHLYNRYVRVIVNGESLGIYLLVEPPSDGIRRPSPKTVTIYRRREPSLFTREWKDSVPYSDESLDLLTELNQQEQPSGTLEAYRNAINIDQYMRWLAINSILRNSDHIDEVFLYEVRSDKDRPEPLQLMAWDYDDIGSRTQKRDHHDDPLLWSALGDIDRNILHDPELFSHYKSILRDMLIEVPASRLESTMRETFDLRQSFDDGRPPEIQAAYRTVATELFNKYYDLILTRHAELCELLDVPD